MTPPADAAMKAPAVAGGEVERHHRHVVVARHAAMKAPAVAVAKCPNHGRTFTSTARRNEGPGRRRGEADLAQDADDWLSAGAMKAPAVAGAKTTESSERSPTTVRRNEGPGRRRGEDSDGPDTLTAALSPQ